MADETVYDKNLSLDEIVFENRNKDYGAYDLRHNYSRILTKAFLIGAAIFILLALSPLIYLTIKNLTKPPKQEVKADLVNILEDQPIIEEVKEKEPPPPPPPPKEEPKVEVIQNVVPEPKSAPKVETPPPPISVQVKTNTGLISQEGVKTPSYTPPPPPPSTGTKAATVEVAKPKPAVTDEVYTEVEQQADFPGGINGFRSKFQDNFDSSVMNGDEGSLKTEVTFVVERDGSITQVKATGSNSDFNREAERAIKAVKTKWTPAKINGQAVRYRFRLPVTMNFE